MLTNAWLVVLIVTASSFAETGTSRSAGTAIGDRPAVSMFETPSVPSLLTSNCGNGSFAKTSPPNFDNGVLSILERDGKLFIGGYFRVGGEGRANGISAFDGSSWRDLDGGIESWTDTPAVACLESFGDDVVAGGHFVAIGDVVARHVARWDGSSWNSIDDGLGGVIDPWAYAMTVYQSELYVGGHFTTAGGQASPGVARWDGSSWREVGGGVNAPVLAFAHFDSSLYVGGAFTRAGNVVVSRVARWDGTTWFSVGDGINGAVRALANYEGSLYAGGDFTTASGNTVSFVAKWDGVSWNSLGAGVDDRVYALAVHDDGLFVGGSFGTAGGSDAARIATWDGSSWHSLSSGMDFSVLALGRHEGRLVAGGFFATAGGVGASRLAAWNSNHWEPLSRGFNDAIYDMTTRGDTLYAVGAFTTAGDVRASHVALWDGQTWTGAGGGPAGPFSGESDLALVTAVEPYQGAIYVGGSFATVDGSPAAGVAYWDGAWAATPGDSDGRVWALATYGTDLYVGGDFSYIGSIPSAGIARWDGAVWTDVQGGTNGTVFALGQYDGALFVGGEFTRAGSVTAYNLACWDGDAWKAVVSSPSGFTRVRSLAVHAGHLYIGGIFSAVDGVSAANIAGWDGVSWSPLASGLNAEVISIATYRGSLYAGGRFYASGPDFLLSVAQWDGTSWCPLGSGMNEDGGEGTVRALIDHNGTLFVGGFFSVVDGAPSGFVAGWETEGSNSVLFSSYDACWCGEGARVAWSTGVSADDLSFRVYRRSGGDHYRAMDPSGLQRHANRFVFQDVTAVRSASYAYHVQALSNGTDVGSFEVHLTGAVPALNLHGSSPNPVENSSRISFELDRDVDTTLELYDVAGRRVRTVMPRTRLAAGTHAVAFETHGLAAGVYFCRLVADSRVVTRKLVIAR